MSLPEYLQRRALQSGSRQASVWAVALSFIAFTVFVMAVRIHVRLTVIKSVGLDDILMIIGTVFTFGLSVSSMLCAYYGVGLHTDQLVIQDMTQMMQSIYSTRLLYVVAIMFVKLSLLVFYLRLDQRPLMRNTVYFLIFIVVGFSIASFFILAFSCYPPEMFWDLTGTVKGECISAQSQQDFYDANGALNIVIDLAIYITPIPMLWNIQISLRQKLALTAIFGLGFVAVADDMYFYLADSLSWCEIEIYVAIFCGSASAFKILFRTYFPGILGSSRGKGSYDRKGLSGSGKSSAYQGLGRERSGNKTTISTGRHVPHNDSEELIIQDGRGQNIMKRTEFHMDVLNKHDDGEAKRSHSSNSPV
ncbi:hypothetical protein F5B20DRAFT_589403 [Whalleya microplaca]|nr:hypothetical protein F5B20DRAFT_589403 [Whalleya microplaca]